MPLTRRTSSSLRDDRDAELTLIAEASHRLEDATGTRRPEDVQSIMAMLDRQQRVAARRALGRPLDD